MKKGFNLFQLNVDRIPGFDALGPEDFSPATADERAAMVENRPSVSYWRDAARRFKANRISMAALFLKSPQVFPLQTIPLNIQN